MFTLPLEKSVCCDFEFGGGVQPLSWQQTGSDRDRVRSVSLLSMFFKCFALKRAYVQIRDSAACSWCPDVIAGNIIPN